MTNTINTTIARADDLCKSDAIPNFIKAGDALVPHLNALASVLGQIEYDDSIAGTIISQNAQDFGIRVIEMSQDLSSLLQQLEEMNVPDMATNIANPDV